MDVEKKSFESHAQSSRWWSERYYRSSKPSDMDAFDIMERRRAFEAFTSHVPYESAVEVGCGTGDNIASCDAEIRHGIDIVPEMIEKARRLHPDVDFFHNDLRAFVPSHQYDLVLALGVIQYVNQDEAFIDKLAELCRAGGHLILSAPNEASLFRIWYYRKKGFTSGTAPQVDKNIPKLVRNLENAGFVETRHRYHSCALPDCGRKFNGINMAVNRVITLLSRLCPRAVMERLAYSYIGLFKKMD